MHNHLRVLWDIVQSSNVVLYIVNKLRSYCRVSCAYLSELVSTPGGVGDVVVSGSTYYFYACLRCFNISCVGHVIDSLQPASVDLEHSHSGCGKRIHKAGVPDNENLGRAITAGWPPVAVFHRELVLPVQMCSCRGVLTSPEGLELLTADVVALLVASGDEYRGTLEDVNVGGVYALPWIICRGAARVRRTGAAPCNPEVGESCTVETRLSACRLSAVRERPRVPGTVSSSVKLLSSVSSSVSDSV